MGYLTSWVLLAMNVATMLSFNPNSMRSNVRFKLNNIRLNQMVQNPVTEDPYKFSVCILGDLHLDPRKMQDHENGRDDITKLLQNEKNVHVISLGDLGVVKSLQEGGPLFSGTSECFKLAKSYLDSYGLPYDVVAGNHDLEGLDEFETDEDNLAAFISGMGKTEPYFCTPIAEKTVVVGLSTSRFRDAPGSSHEVFGASLL